MSCCQRLAPHLVPATLWCWLPWRDCAPLVPASPSCFVPASLWFLLPFRACPLDQTKKRTTRHTQIMRPMSLSVISLLIVVRDRDRGRPRATEGSHSERSISISTGMLLLRLCAQKYARKATVLPCQCCAFFFGRAAWECILGERGNSTISDA